MLHGNALGRFTIIWRESEGAQRKARAIFKRSDRRSFAVTSRGSNLSLYLVLLWASLRFFWFEMSSTAPSLVSSATRSVVQIRCWPTTSYNNWPCHRLLVKSPTRYNTGLLPTHHLQPIISSSESPCPIFKERTTSHALTLSTVCVLHQTINSQVSATAYKK
jgi:hypothetical protein